MVKRLLGSFAAFAGFVAPAVAAQPVPWQADLQPAATEVMEHIRWFEGFTLIIIAVITVFVFALVGYACWRFAASRNPNASRNTHHTMLEVAWTVLPILVLVIIAIPSFRLLYEEVVVPEADLTVKAVGYQWYWSYEYPDNGIAEYISTMLTDEDRQEQIAETGGTEADFPRLLAVDYQMVVPVGTVVRLQVTASDVLHSFAMPAFGVKIDAVPGRLNETWFRAEREGVYYGQCSELCGTAHAFMPIAIRVVSEEQFAAWAETAANDIDAANAQLAQAIREGEAARLAQR